MERKSHTADAGSQRPAYSNSTYYSMLLHALIERVKETTCGTCELTCGDSMARAGYSDLPTFYCETFCDAYFAETDALEQEGPVERELWARARMWKAHLLHTPLWIDGRINGAIYSEGHATYNMPH
ncbi:MAG: hypothetical protein ACXV6K_05195 [Halobacteriota archaeon]